MLEKRPSEMTDEELQAAIDRNLDWQYWLEEGWAMEPVAANRNYHPTEREHNACAEDYNALKEEKKEDNKVEGNSLSYFFCKNKLYYYKGSKLWIVK